MKHKKRSATHPLEVNPNDYCWVDEKQKRKYATELDADLAAPVKELQQYICEHCGYWHNGNKPVSKS